MLLASLLGLLALVARTALRRRGDATDGPGDAPGGSGPGAAGPGSFVRVSEGLRWWLLGGALVVLAAAGLAAAAYLPG